jgi:hypothetical protein
LGGAGSRATDSLLQRKYLVKYHRWRYEDEVRMFSRLKENGLTFLNFNDEDFILRQVILGLRSAMTKRAIVERLRRYAEKIEILKATLSPDEFRIIPRPIDECPSARS